MFPTSYKPGQRLGAYTVVEEIARGGQGVVLKVRTANASLAALKLLTAHDERDERRFLQEGRVLAKLSHPSLPRVHDSGSLGLTHYLCMDYVEGTDLERFVQKTGVPPIEWTVDMLVTVAETVQYLHEQGVTHRDLKPLNVILEARTQRPVLVDFGLVKRDTRRMTLESLDGLSLSRTGEIHGTPAFMAPEQIAGEASEAADVYGLGALLYALLTGVAPFTGSTSINVLVSVQSDAAADPRLLNPRISTGMARFCLSCLEKDPALRPPSARAFALELHALAPRRKPWAKLAAGVALVTAAAVGSLALASAALDDPPTEPVEVADRRTPNPSAAVSAESEGLLALDRAQIARAYAQLETDPAEVLALCTQILERNPKLTDAYTLRAKAHTLLQNHAEAVADFTKALELAGPERYLLLNRGLACERLGQPERAEEDFTQALKLDPKFADAYLCRGTLRHKYANPEGALSDYDAAIRVDPELPHALFERARLLANMGQLDASLVDLARLLKLDSNNPQAYAARGRVYVAKDAHELALEDFTRAVGLAPGDKGLYLLRGQTHRRLENYPAAAGDFTRLLELDPTNFSAHMFRSEIRIALNDLEGALRDLNAGIELKPDSAEAFYTRAIVHDEMNRHAEKIADLERYLELAPNSPAAPEVRRALSGLKPR